MSEDLVPTRRTAGGDLRAEARQSEGVQSLSIPLVVVAAVFTGLAGVIVVSGALAAIAIVTAR